MDKHRDIVGSTVISSVPTTESQYEVNVNNRNETNGVDNDADNGHIDNTQNAFIKNGESDALNTDNYMDWNHNGIYVNNIDHNVENNQNQKKGVDNDEALFKDADNSSTLAHKLSGAFCLIASSS